MKAILLAIFLGLALSRMTNLPAHADELQNTEDDLYFTVKEGHFRAGSLRLPSREQGGINQSQHEDLHDKEDGEKDEEGEDGVLAFIQDTYLHGTRGRRVLNTGLKKAEFVGERKERQTVNIRAKGGNDNVQQDDYFYFNADRPKERRVTIINNEPEEEVNEECDQGNNKEKTKLQLASQKIDVDNLVKEFLGF